jgi:hypothetical protein
MPLTLNAHVLDAPVARGSKCPLCSHPLTELGFLYSGRRFVPREVAAIKGFRINGTLEGFQYGCWECGAVLLLRSPGPID